MLQALNQVSSYLSPDLAIDGPGNAVIGVAIFDATIGVDRASVWVAIGTPAGAWTPQQRITDLTVPVGAYATRVAVSPDGALALVGWIDHYHGTVQVSNLSGGIWGAANTIGRSTAWSSSQEVLGLDAGSGTVARAIRKNAKSGTQTMAASYGSLTQKQQANRVVPIRNLQDIHRGELRSRVRARRFGMPPCGRYPHRAAGIDRSRPLVCPCNLAKSAWASRTF